MTRSIYNELERRILVLDGAMGTLIQGHGLTEEGYRAERFAGHTMPLKGCNDVLVLTAPDIISHIHEAYLAAGADIISTDTFNANAVSLADYGLQAHAREMNRAAVAIARALTDKFTLANPTKPRFVAGSIGPTNKSASMSPSVSDPGARSITFAELRDAYAEQARGMIDGGVDLFLIETVFDTLNAKAALVAVEMACAEAGVKLPVMVSGTVSDNSGRILSGQTVEAFYTSISHAGLLSVGLNCAFGAAMLRPYLERLAALAECRISTHPNAGLPNVMGGYDQTPEQMTEQLGEFMHDGLLNIVGGCCGTTPAHIAAIVQAVAGYSPRPVPAKKHITALSGLERVEITPGLNFVNIGERTNVAGSIRFARLIREQKYEEALSVAREQVESGAQIIDVCMDDGMIDGPQAMTAFLNMAAAEPDVARVPVMIDSSKWEVLEAGLQCTQGRSVVNSISLKEGEEEFLQRAALVRSYGASAVVMLFDERGQADTFERKIEVARRAYTLLTNSGFHAEDIIFDPNVLAIATGIEEHNAYGAAFIEACRWIKTNLPGAKLSGGISNLSFAFRGNNVVREAMHSVFLYHAVAAGLDMGIVNPSMLQIYTDIPADLLELCEDVILNRRPDAAERMTDYASRTRDDARPEQQATVQEWRNGTPQERVEYALVKGVADYVAADTEEIYNSTGNAIGVIDNVLMPAMDIVGDLFGSGKMFLPQVVKSARVMKAAVSVLLPHIEGGKDKAAKGAKVLVATVKGDVHDIGKNIVSVVMSCNGYRIEDLGVMTPAERIVDRAVEWGADAIGLSGLITPSLEEMIKVVSLMERRGLRLPVMIGGATTSAVHTAVMIAPHYSGLVIHVSDASDDIRVLSRLFGRQSAEYEAEVREKQQRVREEYAASRKSKSYRTLEQARANRYVKLPESVVAPAVPSRVIFKEYSLEQVIPYIDWRFFFPAWGLKGRYPALLDSADKGEEARKLLADAKEMLEKISKEKSLRLHSAVGIFPAFSRGDDIVALDEQGREVILPQLRNQAIDDGPNLCLSDYVMPLGGDHVGLFAVTAGDGLDVLAESYRDAGDDYSAIMCKLLADRLAEATAEVTHKFVRRELWGYETDQEGTVDEILHEKYQGIRPAFGYPGCPDHTLKRQAFQLLHVEGNLPMSLTDNYMISPGESVCGIIFADAEAKYFGVGHITDQQITDYAARSGVTEEEVRRLMPNNL